MHFTMGRMHDAWPYLKESIEMTDALQDFETWSAASTMWAQIECFMGEFAQSITNFERVKPTLKSKARRSTWWQI